MFFERKELEKWEEKCRRDSFFKDACEAMCSQVKDADAEWLLRKQEEMEHLRERARQFGGGKILRYGNEMRYLVQFMMKLAAAAEVKGWNRPDILRGILEIILRDPWCFQGELEGWKSDLWTADIGVGTALSWELMRDKLTAEENERVRRAIREYGFMPVYEEWINPETRIHALDTMGHNWWAVCVSGAGVMLLTLGAEGIEGYEEKLAQVTESLQEWFDYEGNVGLNKHPNFGPQGDYLEYVGYMIFGLAHFSIFLTMLEQKKDAPQMRVDTILQKVPDFFLENLIWTQDGLRCADFGDNSIGNTSMQFLYFLSGRYGRKDLLDAVNQMYTPVFPAELLFYPVDLLPSERRIPAMAVYQNSGHAIIRNGYEKEDLVFIMKAGESWNHNHLDVGTFELAAGGEKCITDSGTCTYSNPLYLSYYVQPCAHNTITFDGQGQWPGEQYEGTKYPGRFVSWLEEPEYKYLLADCTGPYAHTLQRFYRHVILSGQKVILVDDVESYQEGRVETYFHGNGTTAVKENTAEVLLKKQVMRIVFPFAGQEDLSVKTGYRHAKPENEKKEEVIEKQDYVSCAYRTKNNRCKCVTVILTGADAKKSCRISAGVKKDVMELCIEEDGRKERYLINCRADGSVMHKNGWISYDGVETDAFLTGLFYDEKGRPDAFCVHNGSVVRVGGQVLFAANRKKNHWEKL